MYTKSARCHVLPRVVPIGAARACAAALAGSFGTLPVGAFGGDYCTRARGCTGGIVALGTLVAGRGALSGGDRPRSGACLGIVLRGGTRG